MTPRRIVKKVGQQQTLPRAQCSVFGSYCVLLVLRAACATLCACCAHSSIDALPRLPHCFRHASARRGCCSRPTGSPTARIWCLTSRRRTIIVSFRVDVNPRMSSLLQFAHSAQHRPTRLKVKIENPTLQRSFQRQRLQKVVVPPTVPG